MRLHKPILTVILTVIIAWATFAQEDTGFYKKPDQLSTRIGLGFRAGVINSFPTVATIVQKKPIYLSGISSRFGYYLGAYIYKDLLPNQVLLRLDATLQQKGIGADYNGKPVISAKYYYIGITPLIGFQLTNHLAIYTGVEANLQILTRNAWGRGSPIELGTDLRLSYTFGRLGAEAGYFRGFTQVDQNENYKFPGLPTTNAFYNQHVQIGLLYNIGR